MGGGLGKEGGARGSGQRVKGVGSSLQVFGRRLQGVRGRIGAEEAGGGGLGAGAGAGRGGRGGRGGGGADRVESGGGYGGGRA